MLLIDELKNIKKLFSATAIKCKNEILRSFQDNLHARCFAEAFGHCCCTTAHGLDSLLTKYVFLMSVKSKIWNPVIPNCQLELIEGLDHMVDLKYKGELLLIK